MPAARGADLLIATRGEDVAFLPELSPNQRYAYYSYGNRYSSWHARLAQDTLRWFVLDDRELYRPDEQVQLKGWVRAMEPRLEGWGIRLPDRQLACAPISSPVATLLVAGTFDGRTPVRNAVDVAAAMPNAELLVMPSAGGSGHFFERLFPSDMEWVLREIPCTLWVIRDFVS